jgi:DNA-binding MarR family transcriptional regulator
MVDYSMPNQFDRVIHNPGRLAILPVLAGCERADLTYLWEVTELKKGTLSKNLTALAEAGYIEIVKSFKGKVPNTSASMTAKGRRAFTRYRREMKRFMASVGSG